MSSYFIRLNGKVIGPLDALRIRQLRDSGKFNGELPISADRSRWIPLRDMEELKSLPEGGRAGRVQQEPPTPQDPEKEKAIPVQPIKPNPLRPVQSEEEPVLVYPFFDVVCPSCSHRFRLNPALRGKSVDCPACRKSFVPAATGQGGGAPMPSVSVTTNHGDLQMFVNILLIVAAVIVVTFLFVIGMAWLGSL
ncbi:hypothetical protein [uncultured Victivallis sp.]|uniref:hypothetical protein n=1 Tax=uncultured Victivallis sp. TaxID=354118 RepID=UPI0025DAA1B9|nr:hypothetical protein [uncultured Victivallis sp.]